MDAQNFNFGPKIPQNVFLAPNYVFVEENFWTKRKFSDRLKI